MVSFSATANGDVSGTLRDFTSSGGDSCRSGGVDSMDSHLSIRLNRSFKPRGIRSSTSKDACVGPSNISTGNEKSSPSSRSSKNLSETLKWSSLSTLYLQHDRSATGSHTCPLEQISMTYFGGFSSCFLSKFSTCRSSGFFTRETATYISPGTNSPVQ